MVGSCGHQHHDHDCDKPEDFSKLYTLFTKINIAEVQCLNEKEDGSGKNIFKEWNCRLETNKFVESDADEELLFNIPFTGCVKLKGVIVIGGEDNFHPSKMKLYKNRVNMTFDDTACEPEQSFEMQPDRKGTLEYITKTTKFSNMEHLSIYFPTNFGEDSTKVYYIGLKGDFIEAHKHGVTICTYEARANPADHDVRSFSGEANSVV